jgi:hypothetical protein
MFSAMKIDSKLLRNLPALLEQHRIAEEERRSRRLELLRQVRAALDSFESTERMILAEATPIEERLTKLRAEVESLEKKLAPLADARLSAEFSCKSTLRSLRSELKRDAADEVSAFQRSLEVLRTEIQINWANDTFTALKNFRRDQPMQARIGTAMRVTLDAFNRAKQIGIEESDVTAALQLLREDLAAEGIYVE